MATQINTGASSGILTREEEHEHFVKGWMPGLELELCKLEESCQPAAPAKRQCSQTRRLEQRDHNDTDGLLRPLASTNSFGRTSSPPCNVGPSVIVCSGWYRTR